VQITDESDNCLAQAFSMLEQWKLFDKADEIQTLGNAAVYKTSVVVYLMLYRKRTPQPVVRFSARCRFIV